MTQKSPDFLNNALQQLNQTWSKLAPTVQLQLAKLLQTIIPALSKLQAKLAGGSTDTNIDNPSTTSANWKSQAAKLLQTLIEALENLRQKLENAAAVQASANHTAIDTEAGTSPTPQLPSGGERIAGVDPEQVKEELNTAWTFVKEQLVPKILSGLTWVAEKIDPPLSQFWQSVANKAQSTPSLVNTWTKIQSSRTWQQANTALAPVLRTLNEKLEPIANSENVKPLLQKRAAVSTMAGVLVLFILFKPSGATQTVAKAPNLPKNFGQPAETLIVPPERGDAPISPEQIMISDIQGQVADVSKKYGEALIQSVQTNFRLGRLIVELTDEWFQLTPVQQDRLVAELFERSQALNFKKLLIADPNKHLLARSPAVGDRMVVLKREV